MPPMFFVFPRAMSFFPINSMIYLLLFVFKFLNSQYIIICHNYSGSHYIYTYTYIFSFLLPSHDL